MIRDITIGQYYPADSKIHILDPRAKIILTFLYIISLFISKDFLVYFCVFVFLIGIIMISKVPLKYIIKGLKPIFIIITMTIIINILTTKGGEVLWGFAFIKITSEGLKQGILMGLRLMFLIIGSSLLTLTTTPIALTDGIEHLLKPLEVVKVPAHEIAMMMTIALRFIPILLEETDKIMKAQMARGADFESGGLIKKAKALIPILIPLFISAFRRADELALAMEARCYRGGQGRTRMNQLRYSINDFIALLIMGAYIGLIVIIKLYYV